MLPAKDVRELPRPLRLVVTHPWARWRRLKLTRRQRRRLRRWLDARGHVTPNFTWAETRSKDGAHVPDRLRRNAIWHAWKLERLRHDVGDVPLGLLSWYRSPEHNAAVGGAKFSQHMQALATDLTAATIARVGRPRLMKAANRIWAKGGVGDYPSGAVHVDSRGVRARWSSF